MQLSTAQLQTLKTWLLANAGSLNDQEAADALNALASPAYLVYKTFVPMQEVMGNTFDWTRVDNLNVGKARIWDWMKEAYAVGGVVGLNPSKSQCRTGINAVWVGTAADLAVRATVYNHCSRAATVAEKLFAVGAGTAPDQAGDGPGTMTAEGQVTVQNVIDALNS